MSADRDRGTRRQKQKRAKEMKKQSRAQREAAVAQGGTAAKAPGKKAS